MRKDAWLSPYLAREAREDEAYRARAAILAELPDVVREALPSVLPAWLAEAAWRAGIVDADCVEEHEAAAVLELALREMAETKSDGR